MKEHALLYLAISLLVCGLDVYAIIRLCMLANRKGFVSGVMYTTALVLTLVGAGSLFAGFIFLSIHMGWLTLK